MNNLKGPKGDPGINPFPPFPRRGLPGDTGVSGLPGMYIISYFVKDNRQNKKWFVEWKCNEYGYWQVFADYRE